MGADDLLESCPAVVEAAREAPGCLDFALVLREPSRINMLVRWDSEG